MVKQIRFISLVCLLSITSCLPPKTTVNSFKNTSYCYSNEKTGLSDLINIDGYYSMSEEILYKYGYPSLIIRDTIERNTIFYDDGILIYSFYKEKYQEDKDKKFGFYNRGMALWGSYIIHNDTIKAIFCQNPGGMSWSIGYVWFKIIDNTTIREIYFKWREPITEIDISNINSNNKNNIAFFVNYDSLPNPDRSWLKRKKWFWCTDEAWKDWVDSNIK